MAVDPYVAATRESRLRDRTPLPPARPWRIGRPGDIDFTQPMGSGFGYQGPDQGYALKLACLLRPQVILRPGERWHDAEQGAGLVALRRCSYFGRAPIKDDVEMGFLVWGFLPEGLPRDLIDSLAARRRTLFSNIEHHVAHQIAVAETVPEEIICLDPDEVRERMRGGEDVLDHT